MVVALAVVQCFQKKIMSRLKRLRALFLLTRKTGKEGKASRNENYHREELLFMTFYLSNISSVPTVRWALFYVLGVNSDRIDLVPVLMMLMVMVKCKFPNILIDHNSFNLLNDSIGYRNVTMLYEDGKFWVEGL